MAARLSRLRSSFGAEQPGCNPNEADMTIAPIAFFTILMSLVYLGLAVLGWGGFEAFFSHPALIVVTVVLLVMTGVGILSAGNLSPGEREDRSNRWVLIPIGLIALLSAYLPAYTDRKEFWTLDGETVRWFGVAVVTVGSVLRIWPVFVLGRRFSGLVAIQPGHTLATNGIYGVVRHPSYLGLLVSSLGWALAFRSAVGLLLTALMGLPLFARIRAEEALLHSQFGAEYDAYRARTPMFIPSFTRRRERTKSYNGRRKAGPRSVSGRGSDVGKQRKTSHGP